MRTSEIREILCASSLESRTSVRIPYRNVTDAASGRIKTEYASFRLPFALMGETVEQRWSMLLSKLSKMDSKKAEIPLSLPKDNLGSDKGHVTIVVSLRTVYSGPGLALVLQQLDSLAKKDSEPTPVDPAPAEVKKAKKAKKDSEPTPVDPVPTTVA